MVIETNSPEETFRVGKELGEKAYAGQVFTLTGDLGVGKTVFTQGLAKGLGIEEPVNSPTFTIIQEYDGGRLPFYHFDVYRIGDVEEMEEVGFDDYVMGEGVSLIEWTPDNKIKSLKEFGCNLNNYDPYQDGEAPIFRDEKANWF